MKEYKKDVFVEKLRSVDLCQIINIENVSVAWKKFSQMFLEILDSVAPVKSVRLKQRSEPWFTEDILRMTGKRNKAWRKFRKHKGSTYYS